MADVFRKEFDSEIKKYQIAGADHPGRRNRSRSLSDGGVIAIRSKMKVYT